MSLFEHGFALRAALNKYAGATQKNNLIDFVLEFHPAQSQRLKGIDLDTELLVATTRDSPAVKRLRSLGKRGKMYRSLKFSVIAGGLWTVIPAFLIWTEEHSENDDLFERITTCLMIFLTVTLVSLIAYSIIDGLAHLISRKATDPFPHLRSQSLK